MGKTLVPPACLLLCALAAALLPVSAVIYTTDGNEVPDSEAIQQRCLAFPREFDESSSPDLDPDVVASWGSQVRPFPVLKYDAVNSACASRGLFMGEELLTCERRE